MSIKEHRDLEPINSLSGPMCFMQTFPLTLTITIEDFTHLGKEFIVDTHSHWSSLTKEEITAVDDNLKRLKKSRRPAK